jgi:hypothetical protein
VSAAERPGLLARLRRGRRRDPATEPTPALPDPALVPRNRGPWEQAALTNVDVTEVVKGQIRSRTLPWQK